MVFSIEPEELRLILVGLESYRSILKNLREFDMPNPGKEDTPIEATISGLEKLYARMVSPTQAPMEPYHNLMDCLDAYCDLSPNNELKSLVLLGVLDRVCRTLVKDLREAHLNGGLKADNVFKSHVINTGGVSMDVTANRESETGKVTIEVLEPHTITLPKVGSKI